jgi:hypothetical protein
MSRGFDGVFSEDRSIKGTEKRNPLRVFHIIVHVNVTFDFGGEQTIVNDMFQSACVYHVITFLKNFNKSFNTSDIDVNRFARVLATLIEGALVL